MRNTTTTFLLGSLIVGSSLALGAAWAPAPQDNKGAPERVLKDKDLMKLSKSLGRYFTARGEREGTAEAEIEVSDEMAGLEKKLSKTEISDILASPADLGQALWMANEYNKKRVKKGKVNKIEIDDRRPYTKKNPLKLLVAVPNNYSPKERWPLILAIPPADQDPTEHLGEAWEHGLFRDGAIVAIPQMPEDTTTWLDQPGLAAVFRTWQKVVEDHSVDPDRVYLAGSGDGVELALSLAMGRSYAFAGVIGRSGDSGDVGPEAFCNLPTLLAGGGAKATEFEAKAKELGFENCTLAPSATLEDIWKWIEDHPRNSYPSKVEYWPTDDLVRSNWVQIDRGSASEGAHLAASIDAGSNTITIDATGLRTVTLLLSDALVDLDRPLRIETNGVSKEAKIVRNRRTFLEMAYKSQLDPGQVYVANEIVDVPAKAVEASDKKEGDGGEEKE